MNGEQDDFNIIENNDEFIIEPDEGDEVDEDIFDQINKQSVESKEVARTRNENEKVNIVFD